VIDRIARAKDRVESDAPGIVFRGRRPALPVLQRAMRDGAHRTCALADSGTYRLVEWETTCRRRPVRRKAGILTRLERRHPRVPLGREEDGDDDGLLGTDGLRRVERRHATGQGLLVDGGASRGNLHLLRGRPT
jgi:hypothetical protein